MLAVAVFVAVFHHRRGQRGVKIHKAGIVVRLPVDRPGSQSEDQAQHAAVVLIGFRAVDIQVFGVPHPRQMRIVIITVHISAHPHDKQGHLLVPVQQAAVRAVAERVRAHRAGIHRPHRVLEHLVALFQAALAGAEDALVFSGEGISDSVLEQGTGTHDDGRLAEVFQHGEELLLDGRHEGSVQQALPEFRRNTEIVLWPDHLGPQLPGVVLHRVGIEHIRPDIIGVVGFNAFCIEFRVVVPDDMAGKQHADGLAPDAAGSDLTALDLHQIPHGEVFPAEFQAGGLRPQQAAHDILFQRDPLRVRRFRVIDAHRIEHAVPAVPAFSGLGKNIENGIGLAAGSNRLTLAAVNAQREIHVPAVPSLGFHRMDVRAAVHRPDVHEDIRGMPDARDGLIDMPLILQRHIAERAAGRDELAGQAEEVADHEVRKPVPLQLGEAVEEEKGVLRLCRDNPVYLDCKGLEAHRRIQGDLPDVRPSGLKHLRRDQLVVIAEAEVDHGAAGQGFIHHELSRDIHVIADVFHLPGYGVAGSQAVDCLVEALDPGTDILLLIHIDTPLFLSVRSANKRRFPAFRIGTGLVPVRASHPFYFIMASFSFIIPIPL